MLSRGAHQDWEKKPASVSLLWSSGFIVLPICLFLLGPAFEFSCIAKACAICLQRKSVMHVRHMIAWRHLPCSLSCHRLLFSSSIAQNDRIDNFATLHTAFGGKLRLADAEEQIHAEVGHHKSAASGAHRFMRGYRRVRMAPGFLRQCSCHDGLPRFSVDCL